jgi:hypothetical protein
VPAFPVHCTCSPGGRGKKECDVINLKSEPNHQWPLNSKTTATTHMLNAIMEFDFLYVVGNKSVLIDTDIYL